MSNTLEQKSLDKFDIVNAGTRWQEQAGFCWTPPVQVDVKTDGDFMKMMAGWVLATCLVVEATFAPTKASNPPSQIGTFGPRLETEMNFLQDALNSVGLVSYVSHGHDSKTGDDWTNRFTDQATRVVASTAACRISYHWKTTRDGIAAMDKDVGSVVSQRLGFRLP